MRSFVLLACVALAYGRPEPPVGYSYSAPASPALYSAPSSGYAAPSGSYGAPAGGHSGSLSAGHSGGLSFGGHSSSGLSLGGGSGFGGGYAGGYSSAPLVQKHIYVHVPPQEPQEYRAPRIHSLAAPQKHYKIIFIKAPTPPTPVAPVIPVQPQNEEKTLVYVLVKKPEEQPDIIIPTPAPTQPAKPEVYFIKYQTQKESGGAIGGGYSSNALGGGDQGSAGPSGAGASAHGGDLSGDFGGDDGSDAGHAGATSSQYGPPGHVAGPLH